MKRLTPREKKIVQKAIRGASNDLFGGMLLTVAVVTFGLMHLGVLGGSPDWELAAMLFVAWCAGFAVQRGRLSPIIRKLSAHRDDSIATPKVRLSTRELSAIRNAREVGAFSLAISGSVPSLFGLLLLSPLVQVSGILRWVAACAGIAACSSGGVIVGRGIPRSEAARLRAEETAGPGGKSRKSNAFRHQLVEAANSGFCSWMNGAVFLVALNVVIFLIAIGVANFVHPGMESPAFHTVENSAAWRWFAASAIAVLSFEVGFLPVYRFWNRILVALREDMQ